MKRHAYSTLPKLASALCIAWSALAGCGDDDSTGTPGSGGGSSTSSSASGTSGGGAGEGGSGQGGSGQGGSGQGGSGQEPGTTTSSTSGGGGGSPSGDTIRFVGRFDTTQAEGPRFSWAGSEIVTRFSGTSISVRFNDVSTPAQSNFFQVVIDGESKGVLKVNNQEKLYKVAEGLPDGEHDLVLHRRTEPLVGVSQFLEFVPEQGEELLPVPAAPERRIEVIGDSISAGYGVDGANATCPFTSDTENNYLAYSSLTGRLLGAETTIVAWSGRGVYRNYNGDAADTMPKMYGRTIADEPTPAWDFSSSVPQVVVINLGTNDFSPGVPADAQFRGPFTEAYAGLVETVRTHYPEAFIFCTIGPMLSDSYPEGAEALTRARAYIGQVVEDRNDGGDDRVRLLEFPPQDGEANGLGCDYHPSVKTNALMAKQLADAIREELDW
ncbi:SGNH/GDSL hydrolase family protein [Sorangium sp. So ce1000]|uniref:SGNH/GDSL hydrolase family protein n=1 Tax=Sorangium sp. So ce1000 TaxID=3133325 RepID=UPI003F6193DC